MPFAFTSASTAVGVGADLFLDRRKRRALGRARVFHCGADHPARIGDEIGHDQHAFLRERRLGARRERNVGALQHELGIEALNVVLADHVGARGRNPDVALDPDHRIASEFLAARVIAHGPAGLLDADQLGYVKTLAIDDGARAVGGRDQHRAARGEKPRRMLAHRAKALDRHPGPFEPQIDVLHGDLGALDEAPAGRADFVERDAAELRPAGRPNGRSRP